MKMLCWTRRDTHESIWLPVDQRPSDPVLYERYPTFDYGFPSRPDTTPRMLARLEPAPKPRPTVIRSILSKLTSQTA